MANNATVPVVVRYFRQGGGPYSLADVGPQRTARPVLPYDDVGHVFAETREGRRLDRVGLQSPVRIRRITVEG